MTLAGGILYWQKRGCHFIVPLILLLSCFFQTYSLECGSARPQTWGPCPLSCEPGSWSNRWYRVSAPGSGASDGFPPLAQWPSRGPQRWHLYCSRWCSLQQWRMNKKRDKHGGLVGAQLFNKCDLMSQCYKTAVTKRFLTLEIKDNQPGILLSSVQKHHNLSYIRWTWV